MRPLAFLPAATLLVLTASLAQAAPPAVIADIPATGSLVQQVLGDLGEVRVLLPAGGNEHHHQLRPSDAGALQDAGLLVWVGPELTPWLARSAETLASGVSLRLLDVPGTHLRDYAGDEGHDEPAAAEHDDDDEGHDHGPLDPHAWLDPQNGRIWLLAIAEALSDADPENAALYAANATAAAARIDAATKDLTAQLAPLAGDRFVVFHDAYGYFTDRFGLQPAIPVSLGDASAPSAARLSALREQITAEAVTCAFPESGHDPALLASLIDGAPIRVGAELDPSGIGQPMGPQLYGAILQGMARTLADCLTSAD